MFGVSAARAQAASDAASDVHLYGLSEEEEPLLPATATSSDIDKYILARNLILSAWRGNVTKQLSLSSALALLPPSLAVHGEIAWTFLTTLGFINFTVAPRDGQSKLHGSTLGKPVPTGSVIVIGAGLAGLTAARQLVALGHKVVVVEAQERAGGRVYTRRLEGGGQEAVGDLGGAVITGIDGNPLAVLARQLRLPMHHIASDSNDDCPLYVKQGALVDPLADAKASEAWAAAENATVRITEQYTADTAEVISLGTFFKVELADKMAAGHPLRNVLRWMYANTEFSAAALATELSATRWADDDKFEFGGAHVWLPGGNARLVKALAEDVPILYNTPVSEVHHGSDGVTVMTGSGLALSADAVIVTVPLGILKAKKILFKPPLPPAKLRAIDRFGFGVLNKVVLLFPSRWWDPNRDTFGHIVPDDEQPGLLYLWYCVAEVAGGHLLAALVAGQAALDIEKMSDEAVMQLVMKRLRSYHPDRDVPYPVSAVVTRWGSDPYTLGSYSSVPPGCNGSADYREIAANVDGRVFFAGEATTYKYPAQMHGAFESGLREAAKVHAAFQCRQSQRMRDGVLEGDIGSENAATMEQQARLALLLAAEFHAGADVNIGCCSAIHAAFGTGRASQWAILRVDVGHAKGSRAKVPCEYHLIPLRAVMEVVDMKGTADECSDFMMSQCEPAVQFHNRKAPSIDQMNIMEEILECRNGTLPDLDDLLGMGTLPAAATSLLQELARTDLQLNGLPQATSI